MNPQAPYDLTRITLLVLIIGVLLAGSLWTLLPFLSAFVWGATIVVATWPLLLIIAGVIGGLIGFGVVGLFIGPVILAVTYSLLKSWVRDDKGAA